MLSAERDPTIREMQDQERHDRYLGIYRHMFHQELGVAAALDYCTDHKLAPPTGLVQAAVKLFYQFLRNEKTHKLGRSAGTVARYNQDMIDFERFETVQQVREQQKDLPGIVEELRGLGAPQSTICEREKMLDWVGKGWPRAYECASMILQTTEAHAGPDAIKASYLRVCQSNREGRFRYHVLGPAIENKLGINCRFQRRGKKHVAFYDLTL